MGAKMITDDKVSEHHTHFVVNFSLQPEYPQGWESSHLQAQPVK